MSISLLLSREISRISHSIRSLIVKSQSLALGIILLALTSASAQNNMGFEEREPLHPLNTPEWWQGGTGFEMQRDTTVAIEGQCSLRMEYLSGDGFGVASQVVPLDDQTGQLLVLTGQIRTESVDKGYAGLWMRIDDESGALIRLDNMSGRGVDGTSGWTMCRIEMLITSDATRVVFGAIFPGQGRAWFDDLKLEFLPPSSSQHDRPDPEPDRLLSQQEMTIEPTREDDHPEWTVWLKDNAHPVSSLVYDKDWSDLEFLRPLLADKRLVQLGESGHGVAEFNMAKTRLIKFMHQELGFDVIMFESGIMSCYLAERKLSERTAAQTMQHSIFGVWHSEATLELFRYLKLTRATDRPLILAGCDYQHTTARHFQDRADFVAEVVGRVDQDMATIARALEEDLARHSEYKNIRDIKTEVRNDLIARYTELVSWLDEHMNELTAVWADEPAAPWVVRQAAWSESELLDDYRPDSLHSHNRDLCMAENAMVVLDRMYPGRKVMHWAHNFHIRHQADKVLGAQQQSTGQHLAQRRRDEMYTIGLYCGRGQAAKNDKSIYEIMPPASGQLAAILEQARTAHLFVDLSRAPESEATSWMDQPVNARQWGTKPGIQVLRNQFDGLFYVDEVRPPVYR